MIDLGIYQTVDGKEYDCHFLPEERVAHAIGPLPEGNQIGNRDIAFEVHAENEQEAKQNLAKEIGSGHWA